MTYAALRQSAFPRPSGAPRWVGGGCTGSVQLAAQYPQVSGAAALEGTRLHGIAEGLLKGWGEHHYRREDVEEVQVYVRDVDEERKRRVDAWGSAQMFIEQPVQWDVDPRLKGTPDAFLVDHRNRHLIIWDLKTGWGLIEAHMNWQLLCYVMMLLQVGWTAEVRIVQVKPYHRLGPIRKWSFSWEDFQPFAAQIARAFYHALNNTGQFVTGNHCLYCDGAVACSAIRRHSLSIIQRASLEPQELPPEHMAQELQQVRDAQNMLKNRETALTTSIIANLERGINVPHASSQRASGGRWAWNDEAKAMVALATFTGTDHARAKLPTPRQLMDLKVPESVVKGLATHQPGRMKVEIDMFGTRVASELGDLPDLTQLQGQTSR